MLPGPANTTVRIVKGTPRNQKMRCEMSAHRLCGEKSEDLVYFAFSKYSEVQYIVWKREIQIW